MADLIKRAACIIAILGAHAQERVGLLSSESPATFRPEWSPIKATVDASPIDDRSVPPL